MTRYRLIKIDPAKEEYADSLIVTLNKLEGWIARERQNLEIARTAYDKNPSGELLNEYEKVLEYYLDLQSELDDGLAWLEEVGAIIAYR